MAYTNNLIPIMTSNTLPYGIASASSENATANAAWTAFDQSNTTFWRSTSAGKTPSNLNYLFILPQVIDKYTITSSTTINTSPNAWIFQGRNGATWTDLDTQTGITFTSNEIKTYTFTNTTQYQEYRINISANNGGTYTEIAEMEMMATISGSVLIPELSLQAEVTDVAVSVASLGIQAEVIDYHAKVSSLNLQAEFIANKARIASLNMQVEVMVIDVPTVTTSPVTNVTETTVTVAGNVSNDGNSTITERGFVYSTSLNPTISDTKIIVSGTTGVMTATITGLNSVPIYHVRAYAINSIGISYGADVSFACISASGLDDYVKLYCKFNGADGSTNIVDDYGGKTITVFGNAQLDTSIKKYGTASLLLDGVGDYLSVPDSDDWDFGSGDFTIDCWLYPSQSNLHMGIVTQRTDVNINEAFSFGVGTNNKLYFEWTTTGSSSTFFYSSGTITQNTWQHVAVVRNGSLLGIFIGGLFSGFYNIGSASLYASSASLIIGVLGGTGLGFVGNIDSLRISKGIARYTLTSYTIPTSAYTADSYDSLLLHGDGTDASTTITDSSTNNIKTVTAYGNAQIDTAQSKFGGASILFDGLGGDYINSVSNADFAFGTGDFTLDFWIRPHSFPIEGNYQIIFDMRTSVWNETRPMLATNASKKLLYYTSGGERIVSGTALSIDTWYHVALMKKSSITYMFINGYAEGSYSDSNNYPQSQVSFGKNYPYDNSWYDGHLDEIRLSKGIGRYSFPSFTPPTDEYYSNTTATVTTTSPATNITETSADIAGNVSSDGGDTITERGFVYSLLSNPTILDSKIIVSGTIGAMSATLITLLPYTIYHVRAYATNVVGTSYGIDVEFMTTKDVNIISNTCISSNDFLTPTVESVININIQSLLFETISDFIPVDIATVNNVIILPTTIVSETNINTPNIQIDTNIDSIQVDSSCQAISPLIFSIVNTFITPTPIMTSVSSFNVSTIVSNVNIQGIDTYTSIMFHMDGVNNSTIFVDSSFNPLTTTTYGNTKISTTQSKFGGASAFFDGTGDSLRVTNNGSLDFGINDYTVDFWVYFPTTVDVGKVLLDWRQNSDSFETRPMVYVDSNKKFVFYYAANRCISTTVAVVNTWYHIALIRSSGITKLYVNGVNEGASYTDSNNYSTSTYVYVGSGWNAGVVRYSCTAYLDEIRVSKGIARWTANFAVPTSEYTVLTQNVNVISVSSTINNSFLSPFISSVSNISIQVIKTNSDINMLSSDVIIDIVINATLINTDVDMFSNTITIDTIIPSTLISINNDMIISSVVIDTIVLIPTAINNNTFLYTPYVLDVKNIDIISPIALIVNDMIAPDLLNQTSAYIVVESMTSNTNVIIPYIVTEVIDDCEVCVGNNAMASNSYMETPVISTNITIIILPSTMVNNSEFIPPLINFVIVGELFKFISNKGILNFISSSRSYSFTINTRYLIFVSDRRDKMHSFTKQSLEIFPISIDFINLLEAGEIISSLNVIGYNDSDEVVTSSVINTQSIVGSKCKVVVKGGVHKSQYRITVRITTSAGNVYEEDVFMRVFDT